VTIDEGLLIANHPTIHRLCLMGSSIRARKHLILPFETAAQNHVGSLLFFQKLK